MTELFSDCLLNYKTLRGRYVFFWTKVAHHSQLKGHRKTTGCPAWGRRGCTPASGSSLAAWLLLRSGSDYAVQSILVQSYYVKEVQLTIKDL